MQSSAHAIARAIGCAANKVRNPTSGREMDQGGTPSGNAESTLDAIPKVIAFLQESLGVH